MYWQCFFFIYLHYKKIYLVHHLKKRHIQVTAEITIKKIKTHIIETKQNQKRPIENVYYHCWSFEEKHLFSLQASVTFLFFFRLTSFPIIPSRFKLVTGFVLIWATIRMPHVEQNRITLLEHIRQSRFLISSELSL